MGPDLSTAVSDSRPKCSLINGLAESGVTGAKPGASYGNRAAWCAYGTDKCLVFQPSRCWTQACCTCVPQVLPLLQKPVLRWLSEPGARGSGKHWAADHVGQSRLQAVHRCNGVGVSS